MSANEVRAREMLRERLAQLQEKLNHERERAEAAETQAAALRDALTAAHKFAGDVLLWCNDPRPATVHDFDAVRAEAERVKVVITRAALNPDGEQ